MKIAEIIHSLEKLAPIAYQESYDNAGLLVGDKNKELTGILIALDTTEAVIEEAIATHSNLIVAHHPILFKGLKKITGRNYVERTIMAAIRHDIAIYAIHTNLDNVKQGVNHEIAQRLGLKNLHILAPKPQTLKQLTTFCPLSDRDQILTALHEAGAGQIGNYKNCSFQVTGIGSFEPTSAADPTIGEIGKLEKVEETRLEVIFPAYLQHNILKALKKAHPYEEVAYYIHLIENENQEIGAGMIGELDAPMLAKDFLNYLKEKMQLSCIKYTPICCEKIQKVALCGGAGIFLLPQAKQQQADIFITADVKYHEFFDADNQIILADIGHYESEVFTKNLLYKYLSEKFTNIAFNLSKVNTNPVNYI